MDELAPSVDPVTWIVVHPREKRSKCSVQHLRNQPGFQFYKYPRVPEVPANYVRLGIGGPVLSRADRDYGLLVLDGTWRWAESMERQFANIPVRSLPCVVTAYPRTSDFHPDPAEGLATIEAIYAAYHALGRPTEGLLDEYHWKDEFLSRNAKLFVDSN